MDALRPSITNLSKPTHAKPLDVHRVPPSELKDRFVREAAQPRPSPNSFAPVEPSNGSAHHHHHTVLARPGASPRRSDHTSTVVPASTALPSFLCRRPKPAAVVGATDSPARPRADPVAEVDDVDDDALVHQEVDDMDEALVDEDVFEQCLDLEEEEQSEDALKTIAEELSATTGLSHAEVLGLLLEQQREKKAKRQAMQEAKKASELLRALVKNPSRQQRNDAQQKPLFLTATPDVCEVSGRADAPPLPHSQPSKVHMPLLIEDEAEARKDEGGEESSARRMKRQLAELFPDLGSGGTTNNNRTDACVNADSFVDLGTYRAQRAAKQHAAVSNHLSSLRGAVAVPKSLETRDAFVKAYELEMRKRRELKESKEEAARKRKEEEDKVRRMKGFFSNEAIRKKIEQKHHSAQTGRTEVQERAVHSKSAS